MNEIIVNINFKENEYSASFSNEEEESEEKNIIENNNESNDIIKERFQNNNNSQINQNNQKTEIGENHIIENSNLNINKSNDKKDEEKEKKDLEDSSINENTINESIQFPYAIEDMAEISEFDSIKNPAIKYPFELDDFQKRSIIRLEQNKNVLVCAHTSSGKTVVAEYGIALGKKNSKRVVYTSPIKALSNQKYREFKKKFGDVGILTGDVNINPDAQCLIMTTEILQNCLYKNSELLSQLEWIVFDEIHYINDNERGHVWEEILILLPPEINLIMLSATIPNYMEFAKWVGSIKKTTVFVEITKKRVVPLKHQIYIDNQNIFEVKSTNGEVHEQEIRNALDFFKEINKEGSIRMKFWNKKADEQQIKNTIKYFEDKKDKYYKKIFLKSLPNKDRDKLRISKMHHKLIEMVDYLQKNTLCPAVIFVFSIKKITEYTRMLSNKNFLNEQEKNKIIKFFNEAISSEISKEDQNIPQISETLEILKSGIGLHHAGLLPILKEIIEVLYSQGLIKVLFATTSFSIGLNMPTRTVVFTDVYKYNDGKKEILSSSEYLQMCGRAGRRGKDLIGNVFIILEQSSKNDKEEIFHMLNGEGTDVKSKLRLTYKTFLSFSSRDKKNMEIFVKDSFLESRKALSIPEKIKEINELNNESNKLKFKCEYDEEEINKSRENISIYKIKKLINKRDINNKNKENNKNRFNIEDFPCNDYYSLNEKYKELNKIFFSNELIYKRLIIYNSGTIIKVKNKNDYFPKINSGNYVMLINAYSSCSDNQYKGKFWCLRIEEFNKEKNKQLDVDEDDYIGKGYSLKKEINENIFKEKNEYKGYKYCYEMYNEQDIINIYDTPYIKANKFQKEILIKKDGKYFYNHKKYFEIILKNLYTKVKDYFIEKNDKGNRLDYDYSKYIQNDSNFKNILSERKELKNDSKKILCYNCPKFKEHIAKYYLYKNNQNKIEEIKKEINPENMSYFEQFKKRKKILKELEYINEDNILTLKGRAAREINTTDCVIITEILLSDIFSNLSDEEVVAFLSGFATNKNQIDINYPHISQNLNEAYKKFLEIYDIVLKEEEKNEFEENKYNRRFMPDVSLAIKSWMDGASFGEICKLTDLEEGKLYTLILRIFLFLEEIYNFYSTLGNVKQCIRFETIKNSLLRGIMGVQSLYLQEKINIDLNE